MKDGYDMGVKAASKVPLKRSFLCVNPSSRCGISM
jgi:hypothetical protein